MSREFSLYLDVIRLFASLLVVLYHSANIYNPGGTIFTLGHEAVVIFFVLSGYVIAFVSDTKEVTLRDYSISRISRIYSVAVPAIIVTMIADRVGFAVDQSAYPAGYIAWDYPLIRILGSLFFVNEVWGLSIQTFSDVPYWSLNYEVWYYISFAALTYLTDAKRWVFFILIGLFLGPKILLLMPIWWLGVMLYRSHSLSNISLCTGFILLFISIVGISAFISFELSGLSWDWLRGHLGTELHMKLAFSRYFVSDYILSFLIAMHFVAIRRLSPMLLPWLARFSRPIRYFSSFTFAIYLLHQPLLLLFRALFIEGKPDLEGYLWVLSSTLLATWALGHYTERKRPQFKNAVAASIDWPLWKRALLRVEKTVYRGSDR